MKRFVKYLITICLLLSVNLKADLANPATLLIKEITPSNFQIVFTLPLISGKVLKAKPIFPEVLNIKGDMEEKGIAGSVVRTWTAECDPQDLVGQPIGIKGLLGTTKQIQLTIEMLNGRKYVEVLQPTKAYFIIPPPPSFLELLFDSSIRGMELVFNKIELVILIILFAFLKLKTREVVWNVAAFAVAQSIGQWLSAQYLVVMSLYLPIAFTALTALFIAYNLIKSESDVKLSWHNPLWIILLLIGLIYGAAEPQSDLIMGLSITENYFVSTFTAVGTAIGFMVILLLVLEFRILANVFIKDNVDKLTYYISYILGIFSAAIFIYEISTLLFIVGSEPSIPIFVLISFTVLSVWSKLKLVTAGLSFSILTLTSVIVGIILSFNGVGLPLTTFFVYGFLAFLGVTILLKINLPKWLIFVILGIALIYFGNYAGNMLQNYSTLPVANSVGMVLLLALISFIIYRLTPSNLHTSASKISTMVFGSVAVGLALLWRIWEYGDWFKLDFSSDLAMGFFPLPILTLVLFGIALLLWPRKRKFKLKGEREIEIKHWVILILAFFTIPLGTIKINNPFSTPGAPSSTEASYIMEKLLSGTYLAFNQQDEEDAFDKLEANLAEDLIADVYLDSRRRLSAGTREGAVITVKDVSVMSVDSLKSHLKTERSYTYPCKWVVTARVKHLRHIHDRQNIYFGDLTIRVENEKWKITKLVLKKEEREILSWQTTS